MTLGLEGPRSGASLASRTALDCIILTSVGSEGAENWTELLISRETLSAAREPSRYQTSISPICFGWPPFSAWILTGPACLRTYRRIHSASIIFSMDRVGSIQRTSAAARAMIMLVSLPSLGQATPSYALREVLETNPLSSTQTIGMHVLINAT